jgi:hypothetical protein
LDVTANNCRNYSHKKSAARAGRRTFEIGQIRHHKKENLRKPEISTKEKQLIGEILEHEKEIRARKYIRKY